VVECEDNPYYERVMDHYMDDSTGEVTFRFYGVEGFDGQYPIRVILFDDIQS